MEEKEQQHVTLFNNPRLTLLEVKMKLRTAFLIVGRPFTAPSHQKRMPSPSPRPEGLQATPNKLRKRNQHYHLIRKVSGAWGGAPAPADHVQHWNDTTSMKCMGKGRQVDSEPEKLGGGEVSWKLQIGELERWATELEMQMEEVNRQSEELMGGTQEIIRGTLEMMKGTAKIRAGALALLRRAGELDEREIEIEKGMANMVKGAEEMIKGAELMEKRAEELKRGMSGPESLEGTSTTGDLASVHLRHEGFRDEAPPIGSNLHAAYIC